MLTRIIIIYEAEPCFNHVSLHPWFCSWVISPTLFAFCQSFFLQDIFSSAMFLLQWNFSSSMFFRQPFSTHVFLRPYFFVKHILTSTMVFFRPCFSVIHVFFAMLCFSPSCFRRAHPNLFYFEILQTQHGVEWLFEFWHVLWSDRSFLFKTSTLLFVKTIFSLAYSFFNRIYLYIYSLSPILCSYNYAVLRDQTINTYLYGRLLSISVLYGPVLSQAFHTTRLWIDS